MGARRFTGIMAVFLLIDIDGHNGYI